MDPFPSTSVPKRPCCVGDPFSAASIAAGPAPAGGGGTAGSMDRILETLLELSLTSSPSISSTVDLALGRVVDSRVCDAEKGRVVDSAIRLASALLESARRSERELATRHNAASWPLPLDLTIKVFSMLDTQSLSYAAATCSMFNKSAKDPFCYTHIDLTSALLKVNNNVVWTMIQRAGKNLRSLKLRMWLNGFPTTSQSLSSFSLSPTEDSIFTSNDKRAKIGKEHCFLTRSCLLALSCDGGTAGALLKILHLHNIDKLDTTSLCTAISACHALLDLEVVGLHVELKQTLETVGANCHVMQRLLFESNNTGRDDSLRSETCFEFVNGCPNLTSLALRGLKLQDHKAKIFVKGLRKLKSIDFSTSYSITGTFLRVINGCANSLEILTLRDCLHLKEAEVSRFLYAVLAGECKCLRHLDFSNRDGLSAEEDWYERCYNPSSIPIARMLEERPDICLIAEFPVDRSFTDIDEVIDGEMLSDISFPLTPGSLFMTSSDSSYNSDQGSGNEDGNDFAFVGILNPEYAEEEFN